MRVLHLISSAGWYGAENVLVNLAAASRSLGCDAVAGVLRDERNPHVEVAEHAQARGVPAEIFPCSGRLDLGAMSALRRYLVRTKVDVLHTHGYKANFYAARHGATPLVTTCHTGTEQPEQTISLRVYDSVNRFLLRRADRVVAVSPAIADSLLRQGVAPDRVATIVNGIDPDRFQVARRRWPGVPEGAKVVGIVGRLIREKGVFVLLQAAATIVAQVPEVRFLFVGDGPERDALRQAAQRAGLGERVLLPGPQMDMPAVYASLDVLAQPSFSEGMPMTILEAMAAGLPLAATSVGAVPALLEPAGCGLLCPPGDAGALSSILLRILQDAELAQRLGEAARAHLREHYSAESMARQYLVLYEHARRGQGGSR